MDETQRILERARQREVELNKENSFCTDLPEMNESTASKAPEPVVGQERRSSLYPNEELDEMRRSALQETNTAQSDDLNIDSCSPTKKADHYSKAGMRSRFAALSANNKNFEYEAKRTPTNKEAYVKGASPRLSIGETRPSALFTPTASYYPTVDMKRSKTNLNSVQETPEGNVSNIPSVTVSSPVRVSSSVTVIKSAEKQTRFATPISEVKCIESTESYSVCSEVSSQDNDKCTSDDSKAQDGGERQANKRSATSIEKRESEDYGIHNFFRRKAPKRESTVESSSEEIPTAQSDHHPHTKTADTDVPMSPVAPNKPPRQFSNEKLSSPGGDMIDELTVEAIKATAALDSPQPSGGHAKSIARKWEEKLKDETETVKKQKMNPARFNTPTVKPYDPSMNPRAGWRRDMPSDEQNPPEIDVRSANVKSLKSRWEVSSATGTPLHPDQDHKELFEAAVSMTKSVNQSKTWQSRTPQPARKQFKDTTPMSDNTEFGNVHSIPVGVSPMPQPSKRSIPTIETSEPMSDTGNESKQKETPNKEEMDNRKPEETPNKNSSLLSAMLDTPEVQSLETSEVYSYDSSIPQTPLTTPVDDDSLPLAHSVSFYRKKNTTSRNVGDAIVLGRFESTPPKDHSSTSSMSEGETEAELFHNDKTRIEQAIEVQKKQEAQATRALHFCRNTDEFRGSREQVDAQRALLIAAQRRRALIVELEKIKQAKADGISRMQSAPKGTLTISPISVKLMRDFVNGHINYHNDHLLFYFIVLIRYGETVVHTTMLTSDDGLKEGKLNFPHYIQLHSLPHDFSCSLEVYALRTQREVIDHHEKYHIRGASLRKSKSPMINVFSSPGGPSAEVDPSFQRVGSLALNIGSLGKTKFQLVDPLSPLDGAIELNLKCYAEDSGTIGHKAFLSLYQDVENMASWTRFWCVLSDGQLRFWRYPEDETHKAPVVSIDLRTCACDEIKAVPVENCPFPQSMQIDVWVPSDVQNTRDKIRVLMAADRKDEMQTWLRVMNGSLRNLTMWNPRR